MLTIPDKCRRGRSECRPLSEIASDCGSSFFCCGENNGQISPVEQDKYTVCFKGPHDDKMAFYDKRDLIHHSAVLIRAVAVIQADVDEASDWSPWE